MDEYIVIKNYKTIQDYLTNLDDSISNVSLSEKLFKSRFSNIGGLCLDIDERQMKGKKFKHVCHKKNIYQVSKTEIIRTHSWVGQGIEKYATLDDIWFNHYRVNDLLNWVESENNINPSILDALHNASRDFILQPKDF